jgi:hypothetical protein
MDALARLEPVARPLLRAVDAALDNLGAPPEHRVWPLLRRVGASPGDAVSILAGLQPERIRPVVAALRGHAAGYEGAVLPGDLGWLGHAGVSYAVRAAALDAHLRSGGDESMTSRLRAAAGYLDDVVEWQRRGRDRMARALGEVLMSTQAVTMTRHLNGGGPPGGPTYPGSGPAVLASADIGARLLTEAAAVLDEGAAVGQRWAASLTELTFAAATESGPAAFDTTIEVRH